MNINSSDVCVYGVRLGDNVGLLEKVISTHPNLQMHRDLDTVAFYELTTNGRERYAGVEMTVKADRITSMTIIPKTSMNESSQPQTSYVATFPDDLRQLFEHYSDQLGTTVFGAAEKRLATDNGVFREYSYDYPKRGMWVQVYAWFHNPKWDEEIAKFMVYQTSVH